MTKYSILISYKGTDFAAGKVKQWETPSFGAERDPCGAALRGGVCLFKAPSRIPSRLSTRSFVTMPFISGYALVQGFLFRSFLEPEEIDRVDSNLAQQFKSVFFFRFNFVSSACPNVLP